MNTLKRFALMFLLISIIAVPINLSMILIAAGEEAPINEWSEFTYRITPERIVDGDTIDVSIDLGLGLTHSRRLRLLGVNTPEVYGVAKTSEAYREGVEATAVTTRWIDAHKNHGLILTTDRDRNGRFGRLLATIHCEQHPHPTLNDTLRARGWIYR